MIFVTVGYQMSFDRMIEAVDAWAADHPDADVFAQIGPTDHRPGHLPFTEFMDPAEFVQRVRESTVLVAHAGMGSILTALQYGKPIVVMPRRGDLQETRNDHQLATARKLADRPGIEVAMDETELARALDRLQNLEAAPTLPSTASPELIAHLKDFIAG
ncbi:MAG: glycosyl transferase family 28 [Phycisphaerae bacterium]|nr:glycosyl transferase family 28 [Phycisphaerae bacterium]